MSSFKILFLIILKDKMQPSTLYLAQSKQMVKLNGMKLIY